MPPAPTPGPRSAWEYAAALASFGLPENAARAYASFDVAAALGALFDNGRQVSQIIGRPTTPLAVSVTHEETGHRSQAVRYLRRKCLHRELFPLRHRPFDNRSRLDSTLAVGTVSYTLDSPQH